MKEDLLYFTLSQINKPIRFWGLSSYQLGGCVFFSAFIFLSLIFSGHALTGLTVLIITWFFLLKTVIKKLRTEHKKGCPDYVNSYFIAGSTPKKIVDRNFIFSTLTQNGE